MPSLTSFSALFLLCLCLCPSYLYSVKELEAQTRFLLAMPTLGSCAGAATGAAQRAAGAVVPNCGSCGCGTLLCLELTACSRALAWGFWHNTVCRSLLQGLGVPHLPAWLDIRSHQDAGGSVCLSLRVRVSPARGELGLLCPRAQPWRSWV